MTFIHALTRKAAQLVEDPTLRRWAIARLVGRTSPVNIAAGVPPYLRGMLPVRERTIPTRFPGGEANGAAPDEVVLPFPGEAKHIDPRDEDFFAGAPKDLEVFLATHRFAWLPLLGPAAHPGAVAAIWRHWLHRHEKIDDSWAWHPYTAAERAINLLSFARTHGLPAPRAATAKILAQHAEHISRHLEYCGEHNTSNHLANNGRGLYWIGLELGLDAYADLGEAILVEEGRRLFRPSGVLREGSTHYHALLTSRYVDAWLLARRHSRPAATTFERVARRALSVLRAFVLPGGMPLVGDVSPDCPPQHLAALQPHGNLSQGWGALLDVSERDAVFDLRQSCGPPDLDALRADGWIRADHGLWSGLWYVSPEGWPPMPGHGHQDCGSFELHYADEVVFCDIGRRSYEPTGTSDTASSWHNTLTVDEVDIYPPNKPYYSDAFRREVAGPTPTVQMEPDGLSIAYSGYQRLGDVGRVTRQWRFTHDGLCIVDRIEGRGRRTIARNLHTQLPVESTGDQVVLRGKTRGYRIAADVVAHHSEGVYSPEYGVSSPATKIAIKGDGLLPWFSTLRVDII